MADREVTDQAKMDVVLCWHMHQPDYRLEGRYYKPWTWLHAIKDYTDMAAHLEEIPGARAVVNFSPVLIEQLQDYPVRIRNLFEHGEAIGDPLLDALFDQTQFEHPQLLPKLVRVNEARINNRFPAYARLFDRANEAMGGGSPLEDHELSDLLVWYVIVWLGESLRGVPLVTELAYRETGFSQDYRHWLLSLIAETIDDILPRYRRLAESGRVELSITPYSHPILPLLEDFGSAHEAMPDAPLPHSSYPDGHERCHWHLAEARRVFVDAFGQEPAGCWPSEGGLSYASLKVIGKHQFSWAASGSKVLYNSLSRTDHPQPAFPQLSPWRSVGENLPACFFRDDGLSDLIGFEYSKWPADDAVDDFIARLDDLRKKCLQAGQESPVLSIIMDGENAWEYYPENGWAFLQTLYQKLAEHPGLRLTTFSDVLQATTPETLPFICAGSWVYGTFSTWVGSSAKNRAWDLLTEAAHAVRTAGKLEDPTVMRQLAICEASDWFWWLSEKEQTVDEAAFDMLFRKQLIELYRMIGNSPPVNLHEAVGGKADGSGEIPDPSGAMRRST